MYHLKNPCKKLPETAAVDNSRVVEQGSLADSHRYKHAERGAVREVAPATTGLQTDDTPRSLPAHKRVQPKHHHTS